MSVLKLLFILYTRNMLSKLCKIKRNFPKSRKNTHFNTNNNQFFISQNLTRINASLAYQGS